MKIDFYRKFNKYSTGQNFNPMDMTDGELKNSLKLEKLLLKKSTEKDAKSLSKHIIAVLDAEIKARKSSHLDSINLGYEILKTKNYHLKNRLFVMYYDKIEAEKKDDITLYD